MSPVQREKEPERQVPAGINAALRYAESPGTTGGSSGGSGEGSGRGARQEGPYHSRGLAGAKSEPERPAEPPRSPAASLYRAHEAAYDPKATGDGFVGPASFGQAVYGGTPLQPASQRGGDPHNVPTGGPVAWARRAGAQPAEVGPPPAHPLSVASPLGIGVAGGAWNAPEPGGAGRPGGISDLAVPAGNLERGVGAALTGGPDLGGGKAQKKAAVSSLREDAGNLRRGAGETLREGGAASATAGADRAITSAWQGVFAKG